MRSIFDRYEDPYQSHRFDEMLMACASVQVASGDDFPSLICEICVEQLVKAYFFKKQVEQVDDDLKKHAKFLEELENFPFTDSFDILDAFLNEPATNDAITGEAIPHEELGIDFDLQSININEILSEFEKFDKTFSTVENQQFDKALHTREIFQNDQCVEEFTSIEEPQRHEQSHTIVYVCKICRQTLERKEHLKFHMLTHLTEGMFSEVRDCFELQEVEVTAIIGSDKEKAAGEISSQKESNHNDGFIEVGDIVNISDKVVECDKNRKDIENGEEENNEDGRRVDLYQGQKSVEEEQALINEYEYIENNVVDDIQETQKSVEEEQVSINEDVYTENNVVDDIRENQKNFKLEEKLSINEDEYIENNEVDDVWERQMSIEIEEDKLSINEEEYIENIKIEVEGSENNCDSDKANNDLDYLHQKKASPLVKHQRENVDSHPKPININVGTSRSHEMVKRREVTKKNTRNRNFPCPVCNEMFNSMTKLDRHVKISHKGTKIYECNSCNKAFSRFDHLNRHTVSHSTIKPFHCTMCLKNFSRSDSFKLHQKQHELCNEISCKICKGTFLSKFLLIEHMKTHQGHSKNFLCFVCGKTFSRKDNLHTHLKRHRGEKTFKCEYCKKGFIRLSELNIHKKYHTGEKNYLCPFCGKGFVRLYNLTVHMRTHTDKESYQCDAAIAHIKDLKKHKLLHSHERYKCKLCTEGFNKAILLTRHVRTVHAQLQSKSG
ncbi:zinc finger protein ZFP2-like isoform X2 [Diorhabda carinulata]|uniref:zinc finger protein ZFP2-like isoform X2 n=1 Tax=Diorhabda carinulata TaxID=1163345 RepID=UPI0025A04BFB|nr:zinc finger protein ZFP2-like isoform X2 [Diorhabda carinulata]